MKNLKIELVGTSFLGEEFQRIECSWIEGKSIKVRSPLIPINPRPVQLAIAFDDLAKMMFDI